MDHQGFAVAGVAREAIAVVIGLQHLAAFAPHRGEGAVAAAEHGGADVDRIHRGAERHVGGRIELAGIGKMLEQFRKGEKALPVIQAPRQHVGRQHFLDDGHREGKDLGVGKDLEATLATCRPWNEPGLKNFAKLPTQSYQDLAVNETAPDSPNPLVPDARQSKTKAKRWLTDAAGNGRWNRAGIENVASDPASRSRNRDCLFFSKYKSKEKRHDDLFRPRHAAWRCYHSQRRRRLRDRRAAAHERKHRLAAIGPRRTAGGNTEQGRPSRTRHGPDRPGDRGSPRRHRVRRRLTRPRLLFNHLTETAHEQADRSRLPCQHADGCRVRPRDAAGATGAGTGRRCHRSRRRMRPRLASRALWRMPAQLRQSRRACLPTRLSHRPLRRLPRQRPLKCFRAKARPGLDPGWSNGSRKENTSKQKDGALGSDSIRTEGCWLFDHVTTLHHAWRAERSAFFC